MSIELDAETRRKIFRQHRDLRQVLAATLMATTDTDRDNGQRPPLLVALGLRLQRMMERHSVFEEAALRPLQPLLDSAETARIEALANHHRQQRVELSLLTKLAFGNGRLGRVLLAFRQLSETIIKQMNVEERELFRGRSPKHQNRARRTKPAPDPAKAGARLVARTAL
jgi:hypothetical protein